MVKRSGFRMFGGSLGKSFGGALTCPPGFYCMDTSTIILIVLILGLLAGMGYMYMKQTHMMTAHVAQQSQQSQQSQQKPNVVVVRDTPATIINPDPRFAPLSPERSYYSPPDIRGIPIPGGVGPMTPINVQTRGYPDSYQQMGVLTTPGGTDNSGTPTRTILPLFGRQLTTNRDRWNYYTRTDGLNPVQVPVQFKRRNCDNDTGCDEVLDGDSVGVPVMGQSFTANIYRYSTPRYLPAV